jgi:uncharacterized protein DUF3455
VSVLVASFTYYSAWVKSYTITDSDAASAAHEEMEMKKSTFLWVGRSWVVIAAALSSACSDNAPTAATAATAIAPGVAAADLSDGNRLPDLTGCEHLAAPVGSTLLLRTFGIGVQIYHWNGTSWGTATPSATIYADAGGEGEVASHFAGPTWQSNSGGSVVGTVTDRCTPDAASIAWLSLSGVHDGPGIFEKVNFIQRLHTVGGNPPSTSGSFLGEERRVPYTADYLFYEAP